MLAPGDLAGHVKLDSELSALLDVHAEPTLVRVYRHPRAMPQYHVGHLARLEAIERATAALPGLALAGNAYRGVGIPDCVHSGEVAAEAVIGAGPTRASAA